MKNLHKYILIIFVVSISACQDFIDLEPETSLSSAVAFDNIQGVEAGINGAYSVLQSDWVERQIIFSETLTSNVFEVNSLKNSNYQATLRHETWTDLLNVSNYLWRMCFQAIDLANQIVVSIPEIAEPNQQVAAEKNRLLGEALFLRGMNYFVLNRFYGHPKNGLSVPILTTPFKNGDTPSRGTIEEVKSQVIQDLKEAESLMAGIENNQGRATVWAVKALLARVYFEYKDYQNAAAYANEVISNGKVDGKKLALIASGDFKSLFSSNISSEHIFTLLATPRANNRLFEIFSLESAAVELSMSKPFYKVISKEKKDLRIKQLHEDFRIAWANYKYDDREMNMPYLRLSEMYLIRAESKVNNGDLDGGLADLWLSGGLRPDVLYENDGSGYFTDISEAARLLTFTRNKVTTGVITGDVDNDGYKDVLLITHIGFPNTLLKNNGDKTFIEMSKTGLEDIDAYSLAAAFGDVNQDGYLDIYAGNYIEKDRLIYSDGNRDTVSGFDHQCHANQLYLNNGDWTFTNVTTEYSTGDTGCALATVFTDYDGDFDPDILVANDFGQWIVPNALLENNQHSFSNVSESTNMNVGLYGMGIATGDYDNDLDLDYYITNLGENVLLKNISGEVSY